MGLSCKPNIYVSLSASELRVRLARPETGLSPFVIIYIYWPFQDSASFVDHLCYFCLVFCYAFVRICLLMSCGHLMGKGCGTWLYRFLIFALFLTRSSSTDLQWQVLELRIVEMISIIKKHVLGFIAFHRPLVTGTGAQGSVLTSSGKYWNST